MIRQAAFIDVKNHLKGGLHCHTTRSDGAGTPEEVIRLHKANGYDFLALTDHRNYNYTNFAPETGITIIPGMEMDRSLPGPGVHCHHIVTIGPEKEAGNPYEQDQKFPSARITTQAECQEMLDQLHADKQMTIYCHPQWSGVSAREFEDLTGNFAMEIWNSGCVIEDNVDTNAAYWDELLLQGKKIYGVATDDGHDMSHHCNGWVMVNSENNVSAIEAALAEGKFYASCGPEIYDFCIDDDGVMHIECSPVKQIQFIHFRFPYRVIDAPVGDTLTAGSMKLREGLNYVRATIVDEQGRRAWTNPIFLDWEQK